MRILRNKHNRRTLSFFRIAYGIQPPFKVLIDGNFVVQVVKMQQRMEVVIERALMEKCFLHITECALRELRSLPGDGFAGVVAAASGLPLVRCSHKYGHPKTMDASTCLLSIIGDANALKFFVATQDTDTRSTLRSIPGVPLLLYSQNVLVLEPPSKASRARASTAETKKNSATAAEIVVVKVASGKLPKSALASIAAPAAASIFRADRESSKLPSRTVGESVAVASSAGAGAGLAVSSTKPVSGVKRKARGPSGPNPLSVRKKTQAAPPSVAVAGGGADRKKIRRRHKSASFGLEAPADGAAAALEAPPAAKRARVAS